MTKFHSMAHRAWFAYQALERDEMGKPPPIRPLEREHGLSNAQLSKLLKGELTNPGPPVMRRLATALRTTVDWLAEGIGDGPTARWPIPPYPLTWVLPKQQSTQKGESILSEELSTAAIAAPTDGPLRIAKRGAKKSPSGAGAELSDKRKATGRLHKAK